MLIRIALTSVLLAALGQSAHARDGVMKFKGLVAGTAESSRGTITDGNGKITLIKATVTRSGDKAVLKIVGKRGGLLGIIPGLRWKKNAELSGTVTEENGGGFKVAFGDTNANRLATTKKLTGGAGVTGFSGELVVKNLGAGVAELQLKENVKLHVPGVGPISIDIKQFGDQMSVSQKR